MTRNGVSTAYDPISGRFLIAHACPDRSNIIALATPSCSTTACREVSTEIIGANAAETPVVACGNQYMVTGGVTSLYSNCRLVYAQSTVAGQNIAWRVFGMKPGVLGRSASILVGGENQTNIGSEHAPAVAWYIDSFIMALSVHGTEIRTYYSAPWAPEVWTQDTTVNSTGWVSPPFLSPTHWCQYIPRRPPVCYDELHIFWTSYPDPP
jgi:hypothetical protein